MKQRAGSVADDTQEYVFYVVDNDDRDDATERFSNDTSVYRANQTNKKSKKYYTASYLIYLRIFIGLGSLQSFCCGTSVAARAA